MRLEQYYPTSLLKPFVRCYRIVESQEGAFNRVLPNTSIALAFRFKGQNAYASETGDRNLPPITISGLRKSVRLISYANNSSALIVLFKEGGASAFFKEPLHELFEESVSLDELINANHTKLVEEQLCKAPGNEVRVALVEEFLLKRMRVFESDKLVSASVERITSVRGAIRIRSLAESLHISNDAFEKRFRKTVGASPKQFASLVRMSAVIRNHGRHDLLESAFDAGFYDQSHFIKSFRLFTGQTPTDFFRSASYW